MRQGSGRPNPYWSSMRFDVGVDDIAGASIDAHERALGRRGSSAENARTFHTGRASKPSKPTVAETCPTANPVSRLAVSSAWRSLTSSGTPEAT